MWSMMAMKKGTAMKDKKKRSSPPPSTGTYPEGSSPLDIGCSHPSQAAGALHASVQLREASSPPGAFLQLTDAGGNPITSPSTTDLGIADYVAVALQSETPINHPTLGNPMEPGVIRTQGGTSADVLLVFMLKVLNGSNSFNGGSVAVSIVNQTGSGSVSILSGASTALTGNPPTSGSPYVAVTLSRPTNNDEIILEFRVTGSSKSGNVTTSQVNPVGSALKNGSCYVKVIFN